jgi:endonuclease/exonuclease/phosphatase family metal-dependent hydrolase
MSTEYFLTSAQYTFFLATHGTFPKIDYILGHKASLSKYKKAEIIPCTLSDHNALKLELNNKKPVENMQTIGR